MPSKTGIANMALSHLGMSKEIADLDLENSPEANACRRFYETTRDSLFREFNWPFTMKISALGLVEEKPNNEWQFSYRYPSDSIKLRRILSGSRNDSLASKVPYRVGRDGVGRLIFTDCSKAMMEYTLRLTTTEFYPEDFVLALSYKLAFFIAPRITKGDPNNMGQRVFDAYKLTMADAAANAWNEEQVDQKPESEFISIRNGGTFTGSPDGVIALTGFQVV